jgi:hypothetical protein
MSDPSTTDQHLWYLEDTGEDPFYRLHTRAKGNGQSLDVDPDNNITVLFRTSGDYAGQFWRLDASEGGTYRLSNNWTGTNKHLDTYRDTLTPHLAEGDANGQLWTFSKYENATSGTSTSVSMSTGSASATVVPANSPSKDSAGLSKGAIAGIVVGGLVGLALLLGAILFWLRRTHRQRSAENFSGSETPSPGYPEKDGSPHYMPVAHHKYQHPVELGTGQPVELGTDKKPVELNS